jgi:hypothetical protein
VAVRGLAAVEGCDVNGSTHLADDDAMSRAGRL